MSSELIWGIIGTITGIIGAITGLYSLYLTRKRMQREEPHLGIRFIECFHTYSPDKTRKDWLMYFRPLFRINNIGDRGTTVSKVEIVFKLDNKEFTELAEGALLQNNKIDAHSTVDLSPLIYSYDETIRAFKEQGEIKCIFTLFHTHGKETIEGTSEMVI